MREIERGVNRLGFKGVIINSHTRGEYLDDKKFWPVLEAAEALDTPIYLHPNTPSPRMIEPMLEAGLDGTVFGFAVETGLHLLRDLGPRCGADDASDEESEGRPAGLRPFRLPHGGTGVQHLQPAQQDRST
ncbi:amidohydrolase family protein [Streptomyces spongiae]|uniref:amidohydrolase family protein n=1 Tax=Streptomyces spongiae TaxID=565072 RepID=UPI002AD459CB|nr:amidohydrolase family protein [Streptomyces spongiae]